MIEEFGSKGLEPTPEMQFEKGDRVALRGDAKKKALENLMRMRAPDASEHAVTDIDEFLSSSYYRVLGVDPGGEVVFIGPGHLSDSDVEKFSMYEWFNPPADQDVETMERTYRFVVSVEYADVMKVFE